MIYSCFQEGAGVYRYFRDDTERAVNSDLPVPSYSSDTKIGAPSRDAARPFPSGAKPIGKGWHARGIIVKCPSSGLGALGDLVGGDTGRSVALLAAGLLAGAVVYGYMRKKR